MSDDLLPTLTEAAAEKIKQLIEEEGEPSLSLRVFITGGGCSGFQYGFSFVTEQNSDDNVIEKVVAQTTVRVLVDPVSLQYLEQAEIDYRQDINGERFVIRNPNAQTTCGCGSSFSVE